MMAQNTPQIVSWNDPIAYFTSKQIIHLHVGTPSVVIVIFTSKQVYICYVESPTTVHAFFIV